MARTKGKLIDEPSWYGQTPPAGTLGVQNWRGHNGNETWSDGGESEKAITLHTDTLAAGMNGLLDQLQSEMTGDMQAIICAQVQGAIVDYAQTVEFALSVIDGEVCIGAEMKNDKAWVRPYVPLAEVMAGAMRQAYNDKVFLESLVKMLNDLMATEAELPQAGTQAAEIVEDYAPTPIVKPVARPAVQGVARPSQLAALRRTSPERAQSDVVSPMEGGAFGAVVPARRRL